MVHFFTTPYLMAKNSLSKMNPSWETTGELLGDSWLKTLVRVVIPNSFSTIIEMFSYLFINSMVTISAIIFLVGTATAVMTTKIKELQHYAKFKEIFVLSILIFLTNLFVRLICDYINKKLLDKNKTSNKKISNRVLKNKNKKKNKGEKFEMGKILKLITAGTMALTLSIGMLGCGAKSSDKVVIYTNADEEAIEIMQNTLNEKGYEDKYVLQSFGTSELGGKLIAEGDKIEADIVTMSSYFIESAQEKNNMFTDLTFDTKPLSESTKYSAPIIYNNGYDEHPNMDKVKEILDKDTEITHIAMVHCETTTGILNPIEDLSVIAKEYNKTLIIDAMSSFGGIPIDIKALGIDYLISSANKCIQGVPGFGFVIAKKEKLEKCKGISRSLSLDLYDQYKGMDKDGKWRFTSPTHVVAAFSKALDELKEEGGVEGRYNRYKNNNLVLRKKLKEIGIESYIEEEKQSPIITTFAFPTDAFSFNEFYSFIKERGLLFIQESLQTLIHSELVILVKYMKKI